MHSRTVKKSGAVEDWDSPKDLEGVLAYVRKCVWAHGFGNGDRTFKCNECLYVKNVTCKVEADHVTLSMDVDYDNCETYITKPLSARYGIGNYRDVHKDLKHMEECAERLSATVFVGPKFYRTVFKRLGLEGKGWQIIR